MIYLTSCPDNNENDPYLTSLQLYAFTSMGVVVLSTVVFILSTMPELTDEIDMILFTNTTDASTGQVTQQPVERWEDVSAVIFYNYLQIFLQSS